MENKFGKRLRVERNKKGYSQGDVAIRLGVYRSTVSKWERGEYIPSAANLNELKKMFDLPFENSSVSEQIKLIEHVLYKHGWTIRTLAKELDVSVASIQNWKNGKYFMNPESFRKLKGLAERLDKNDMDWGVIVKDVMELNGFETNTDLAKELDVSSSVISHWVVRRNAPSGKNQDKLLFMLKNPSVRVAQTEEVISEVQKPEVVEPKVLTHTLWERIKYVFTGKLERK